MNQSRFFLAADYRNVDSGRLLYRPQNGITIGCFPESAGSDGLCANRMAAFQLLLKVHEGLDGPIDRVGGYSAFGENVLSEPHRFPDAMNNLISTVGTGVC